MKYQLTNNNLLDSDNYAESLMRTRGILDILSYINPAESNLQSPYLLDNISLGADLLIKHLNLSSNILFIVDCDVDGYTSSAILWNYIKETSFNPKLTYYVHEGKQHGLEDMMDRIENESEKINLVILPDSSSNDYSYHKILKAKNVDVLVLDHHDAEEYSEDAIVINNQLSIQYNNKHLTGAGIVWQFCRVLDEKLQLNLAYNFIDLACLGIISDMGDVTNLENRYMIKQGLTNVKNFFFRVLLEKQSFSIGNIISPIGIAFYITPLINALIRVGDMDSKEKLFEAFVDGEKTVNSTKRGEKGMTEYLGVQMARTCTNARVRQNKTKEDAIAQLDIKIMNENLLENKVLFIILDEEYDFPPELNGLVAMNFSTKYKKPTILARTNKEGYIRGSARGLDACELTDFKAFLNDTSLFEYCEGHAQAFGVSIKQSNINEFLNKSNRELANIDFSENIYDVDFICDASDKRIPKIIFDLDILTETYGQKNSEPLIAIENLIIDKENINIKGKNQDALEIIHNGVCYMMFKSKDFLEKLKTRKRFLIVNLIGKSNVNDYMGRTSPQIFINNIEIIKETDYIF